MTVKGIDVASFQSNTYSTSGLSFVMVKATEGTTYTNPKHADQVAHARSAGLVVGHYHFARPGSVSAQASYFLAHAAAKPGDILILDWEDAGFSAADKDAWLAYVSAKAPAYRNVLYCNKDFWLHRDTTSVCGDGLWIADPDSPAGHPAVQHAWTFHQYAVTGGTDQNVADFDSKTDLAAWAKKATPVPPKPAPAPKPTSKLLTEAQMVTGLYNDVMSIGSLDGDGTHAAGYFLAHGRHDALSAFNAVVALETKVNTQTIMIQEILDAVTKAPQAVNGAQTANAAAFTSEEN